MARTSYDVRAKHFIEQIYPFLYKHTNKFRHIEPTKVNDAIRDFDTHYSRKVMVYCGCSRIAIISSDYVIKMDITECYNGFGDCNAELSFYQKAKQEGYANYFCPIESYSYKDITFYIMPKVRRTSEYDSKPYFEDLIPDDAVYWISERVYDIHKGNYGFFHKHPVIIDYACNCLSER